MKELLTEEVVKVRGFEPVSKYKHLFEWTRIDESTEEGPVMELPRRQTLNSAGYDIQSAETVTIYPIWWIWKHIGKKNKLVKMIPTGLKVYMEKDEYLQLLIRSSFGVKRFLMNVLGVGVIDSDYYDNPDNEGHIFVPYINLGFRPQTILIGERIAQGIFSKFLLCDNDHPVNQKRKGGHGSTTEGGK